MKKIDLLILFSTFFFITWCKPEAQKQKKSTNFKSKKAYKKDLCEEGFGLSSESDKNNIIKEVQLLPVEKLKIENFEVENHKINEELTLEFLKMSAKINDPFGYVDFEISSIDKNEEAKILSFTEKSPSNIPKIVYHLGQGTFTIKATPCNSLGCNSQSSKEQFYEQVSNIVSYEKEIHEKINDCKNKREAFIFHSGQKLVKTASKVKKEFEMQKEKTEESFSLYEENSQKCFSRKKALKEGSTALENMEKIGPHLNGEIIANKEILEQITEDIKKTSQQLSDLQKNQNQLNNTQLNNPNTSSQAENKTNNEKSQASSNDPNTSNKDSSSKKWTDIFFKFGVPALVGGSITAIGAHWRIKAFNPQINTKKFNVELMVENLSKLDLSKKAATDFVNSKYSFDNAESKAFKDELLKKIDSSKKKWGGKGLDTIKLDTAKYNKLDNAMDGAARSYGATGIGELNQKAFKVAKYAGIGAAVLGAAALITNFAMAGLSEEGNKQIIEQLFEETIFPLQKDYELCIDELTDLLVKFKKP